MACLAVVAFSLYLILNISNGVIAVRPLLLISMDGMRADYFDQFLQANPSCNFNRIINNGLKADYMIPAFPSQTFPNHWTLVTGINAYSSITIILSHFY